MVVIRKTYQPTDEEINNFPLREIRDNTLYFKSINLYKITYSDNNFTIYSTYYDLPYSTYQFHDDYLLVSDSDYYLISKDLRCINITYEIYNCLICVRFCKIPLIGEIKHVPKDKVKGEIVSTEIYLLYKNVHNLALIERFLSSYRFTRSNFPIYSQSDIEKISPYIEDIKNIDATILYHATKDILIDNNSVLYIYENFDIMPEIDKFKFKNLQFCNKTKKYIYIKKDYYLTYDDYIDAAAKLRIFIGKAIPEMLLNRMNRTKSAKAVSPLSC